MLECVNSNADGLSRLLEETTINLTYLNDITCKSFVKFRYTNQAVILFDKEHQGRISSVLVFRFDDSNLYSEKQILKWKT